MFQTPESRYLLRSGVSALIAGVVTAAGIWVDNPYLKVAGAIAGALGLYLGVGQVSGSVEPFVGRKMDRAEVPAANVKLVDIDELVKP